MIQRIKSLLKDCLPPVIFRILKSAKHLKHDKQPGYLGEYATWEEAVAYSTGYDEPSILEKTKKAILMMKHGEAVYERDSVVFDHIEYSLPVLGGLLLAAAINDGRLSVLDFGGSLGSSYFQNRKFLNILRDVRWGIVEQPHYVTCGKEMLIDEKLHFFNNISDCVEVIKPNVILLGSVLQYLKNPYDILEKLLQTSADFLIIDRTPFSTLTSNRIIIQNVPFSVYKASYPMWIFSRGWFDKRLEQRGQLIDEFESDEGCVETKTGIKFKFQGMVFQL